MKVNNSLLWDCVDFLDFWFLVCIEECIEELLFVGIFVDINLLIWWLVFVCWYKYLSFVCVSWLVLLLFLDKFFIGLFWMWKWIFFEFDEFEEFLGVICRLFFGELELNSVRGVFIDWFIEFVMVDRVLWRFGFFFIWWLLDKLSCGIVNGGVFFFGIIVCGRR